MAGPARPQPRPGRRPGDPCIVGVATAGDRFASVDNVLTILRLASVIGVVSVGMTFVIIGGGIDLSVGALVALSSVWATTLATQHVADGLPLDRDGVTALAGRRGLPAWSTAC